MLEEGKTCPSLSPSCAETCVRSAGLRYSPRRDGGMKSHFQASQPVPSPEDRPGTLRSPGAFGQAPRGLAMLHAPRPRRGFRPTRATSDTRDL